MGFSYKIVAGMSILALLFVFLVSAAPKEKTLPEVLQEHVGKTTVYSRAVFLGGREEFDVLVRYKDEQNNRLSVVRKNVKKVDIGLLLTDPMVLFLEVDQDVRLLSDVVPWNVVRVGASSSWNVTTGSGVKVAVLDSGVASHQDLVVAGGWNVLTNTSDYTDVYGHGTLVAGVLSAVVNDVGVVGVSPGVDLYAVKVFDGSSGKLFDVLKGIAWARDQDVDIMVMSFALEGYSQILKDELSSAYGDGLLLVAASGNDGGSVRYPAAYDSVISVGATDEDDVRASFSSFGIGLELVAPGFGITSTGLEGYGVVQGTSFAAPHVAGVAALVWSYNRSLMNVQVRGKLRNDAVDLGLTGKDDEYGYGLVQLNLYSTNYTLQNNSYYYEIYNITKYGKKNEVVTYWSNGTGTINDIIFEPGYYRVVQYLLLPTNITIMVDERGSVELLFLSAKVELSDNYVQEGSSTDGKLWTSGTLSFKYRETGSEGNADVVCFDYDMAAAFSFDYCYASSSSALSNCKAAHSSLNSFCGPSDTNCETSSLTSWHALSAGYLNVKTQNELGIRAFYQCSGSAPPPDEDDSTYHVMDQKRTECTSTASIFRTEGRTAINTYKNIDDLSCAAGKVCDSEIAGDYITTSSSYDFTVNNNPCRTADGESCTTDNNCLTSHTCTGGVCTAPANQTTDLAIVNIVTMQVVPNVKMIRGKSGYVVVNVTNKGDSSRAYVKAWFNGNQLTFSGDVFNNFQNTNNRTIPTNNSGLFVFNFTPASTGTNIVVNATVEVGE